MGYIYKITNKINGKSYIGQTITPIRVRMYKHYSQSKIATTGVDYAIQKYGRENFTVEQICKCDDNDLDHLERYYIDYYDTYNNGYNLTIGGQDTSTKLPLDTDAIIAQYLDGKTIIELTDIYNCCEKTISNILHSNNIKIRHHNNLQNIMGEKRHQFQKGETAKAVYIPELDKTFTSLAECSEWLMTNGYSKANSMIMARKSISRVLCGERKTYCGLHFEYA